MKNQASQKIDIPIEIYVCTYVHINEYSNYQFTRIYILQCLPKQCIRTTSKYICKFDVHLIPQETRWLAMLQACSSLWKKTLGHRIHNFPSSNLLNSLSIEAAAAAALEAFSQFVLKFLSMQSILQAAAALQSNEHCQFSSQYIVVQFIKLNKLVLELNSIRQIWISCF